MKPIFLLCLMQTLCFGQVISGNARAGGNGVFGSAIPAVGGGSCPANGSPSVEQDGTTFTTYALNKYNGFNPYGQAQWSDSSTRQICKIGIKLLVGGGDVSGKHYHCEIWTLDANTNHSTTLGTSETIHGDNSWNASWAYFNFSSPVSITADTQVAFVVTSEDAADEANFVQPYRNESGTISGNSCLWFNGASNFETGDFAIKLFYYE